MSTEHTQGPWRVSDSNDHGDLFIAAEGDTNALVVAQMLPPFPGENSYGCVRANANLIAACPALLEACRRAFDCLCRLEVDGTQDDIDALDAAIAQATPD